MLGQALSLRRFGWDGTAIEKKGYDELFGCCVQLHESCVSMSTYVSCVSMSTYVSCVSTGMYIRRAFLLRVVSSSFLSHATSSLSYESTCHSLAPLCASHLRHLLVQRSLAHLQRWLIQHSLARCQHASCPALVLSGTATGAVRSPGTCSRLPCPPFARPLSLTATWSIAGPVPLQNLI